MTCSTEETFIRGSSSYEAFASELLEILPSYWYNEFEQMTAGKLSQSFPVAKGLLTTKHDWLSRVRVACCALVKRGEGVTHTNIITQRAHAQLIYVCVG